MRVKHPTVIQAMHSFAFDAEAECRKRGYRGLGFIDPDVVQHWKFRALFDSILKSESTARTSACRGTYCTGTDRYTRIDGGPITDLDFALVNELDEGQSNIFDLDPAGRYVDHRWVCDSSG